MDVGFVGLGQMGQGMARNLIKAGHGVVVWNRTIERAAPLVAEGARAAEGLTGVVAPVLITMLANDPAVEEVMLGPGKLLSALPRDAVHVSMSTISPALSRRLAALHHEAGQGYVAAPVFGRPEAAAAGKLFIMAAGPTPVIERCRPLFDAMGQKTYLLGEDAGAANIAKLAGNFLLASVIESLAEAMALVRKSGIDPRQYLDILTDTIFPAPVYRNYGGMIAEERYLPAAFQLPLGLKDVDLALAAAQAVSVPMPVASLIRDQFITAIARGHGQLDWSALGRVAAENAGLWRAENDRVDTSSSG